ncbi:hypothetical protein M3_0037 [Lysinibacillus phage vB_LfM_LysYB1]|nr:hypothetical protein M3_0037 [Lysinibacillus phage vB_LfM_LysYB1]WAB25220.1 hypothetical protein M5_0042 [Lysinibacillus phage vB_LfM_LysYB2]
MKKNDTQNKPKKRKNSRAKGAGFERVAAKLLTEWWGAEFHRTPASGGLHWKRDNRVAGDIVAPAEATDYPFSNECKKVEGWNFEQIIKGTGLVTDWWSQCCRDASETDKIPLLLFSKNRSPIYYMVHQEHHIKIVDLPNRNYFITTFELEDKEHCVAIGMFDDLLSIPKASIVKNLNS